MDPDYSAITEPATPEYVLAVFRDQHRQSSQFDPEVDPDATLSLNSTVAEWRLACDLLEWRDLGRAYNEMWSISGSDDEWRAVLEPATERRLAGVCEFIASRVSRPLVRPARILGTTCDTAGAFLTVRSLLNQAGACVDEIAPSTPLGPFARQYFPVFLGPISRLAPGSLPPVRIRTPIYDLGVWGIVAGLICFPVGFIPGLYPLAIIGAFLFILSYSLTSYAARHILPASVEFGDLKTFRDLSVTLTQAATRK